jgi:integrase
VGLQFYEDAHCLRDGAILVYTRAGHKKATFQARLKVPGVLGYVIRSLKTRDLPTALNEAEDLFYALRAEQKQGLDVKQAGNLKFKDLWKRFYAAHEAGLSIHRQRLHQFMERKYFTPYFGEHRVADLPDAFVEQYWDWRINFHKDAKKAAPEDKKRAFRPNVAVTPSQKTLEMEGGMLRQIFRWGKRVGFVKREPWIKAPKVKHTKGVERRPTFTEDEWRKVYEYLRDWVKEPLHTEAQAKGGALTRKGPHKRHRFHRELLRNYLLFMANSGLRPNEARQLRWADVRIEQDGRKKSLVVEVAETTKTGARVVVCREGAEHYLARLKEVSSHTEPKDLVFGDMDGEPIENFNATFKSLLEKLKLLTDRHGKRRTIYSLRHFYCTQALLSEVPIHILAKNMGTSVAFIQSHYSHVLTLMQAKQLRTKKFKS